MAKIDVFEKSSGDKSLPGPTFVNLWLSSYSSDSEKRVLLSPELASDREVDDSVDYLIQQFERARKKAKKILNSPK